MTRSPSRLLGAFLVTLSLLAFVAPASAQTVLIRVVDGESMAPTVGALAYLVNESGGMIKNTLTDERGRGLFVGIPAGSYRVRVEMIGMASAETDLFAIAEGTTITEELRLESSAIQLEGLEVELEAGRCRVRGRCLWRTGGCCFWMSCRSFRGRCWRRCVSLWRTGR